MSRRGRVFQPTKGRGKPWSYVTDIGRPGGERKQLKRGGFRTQADAFNAMIKSQELARAGRWVPATDETLGSYMVRWAAALASKGYAPTSVSNYGQAVRSHILPYAAVADIPLNELTAGDLNDWYAQLLRCGNRLTGAALSPRTVRIIHAIVRKALGDALKEKLVLHNVAADASPPSPKSARTPEKSAWTAAQLRQFLKYVELDSLYPLIALAAATGARRGEILGLRWKDIDFQGNRIYIRQTRTVAGGKIVTGSPKTDRSRRVIDVDPQTMKMLENLHHANLTGAEVSSPNGSDDTLVFVDEAKEPLDPSTVSSRFRHLVKDAKLPDLTFHGLRHTHATILLAGGEQMKLVSERLGHADVGFTLSVYNHVSPIMHRAGSDLYRRLVNGDDNP